MASDLETRERILLHARDKFLQMGFSKVTIDEIALDLGISKKTLYKFYPSKEELMRAAVHLNMRMIDQELQQIVSSDKPFAEKLAEALMMLGKFVGRISRSCINDMQRFTPALWKELEQFRREHVLRKLATMIQQARAEKVFRDDVHDQVLIFMLISAVQGIVNPEVLSQNAFSTDDAFRTIFRVLFEGALTDDARKGFHLFDKPI
jgi:AcrR family transcriptional regulator